jgi:hypothetical protein
MKLYNLVPRENLKTWKILSYKNIFLSSGFRENDFYLVFKTTRALKWNMSFVISYFLFSFAFGKYSYFSFQASKDNFFPWGEGGGGGFCSLNKHIWETGEFFFFFNWNSIIAFDVCLKRLKLAHTGRFLYTMNLKKILVLFFT